MTDIHRPTSSLGNPLIRRIVEGGSVSVSFQPICSVRKRQVVGVEALIRGIDSATGETVPPGVLFGLAEASGQAQELDRVCRKAVLEAFRGLDAQVPGLLLFMNFEAAIIERGAAGSGHLIQMVRELGLDPSSIVIELIASRAYDMDVLEEFVERHKSAGFNIALGDMGAGHASLERVALLKPDVLKIDRVVVHEIDQHFHKQEVLRSVYNLARKTGALVIAEGLETEAEAQMALAIGADLVQGYFLGKPSAPDDLAALEHARVAVERLCANYLAVHLEHVRARVDESAERHAIVERAVAEIAGCAMESIDAMLSAIVHRHPGLECVYVIDAAGVQVSSTVFDTQIRAPKKHFIFKPAERGTDHSIKEYFFLLQAGLASYTTDPYISLASGNFCRTISRPYRGSDGATYIVCLDFAAQAN